jgi:hypothetical protein
LKSERNFGSGRFAEIASRGFLRLKRSKAEPL